MERIQEIITNLERQKEAIDRALDALREVSANHGISTSKKNSRPATGGKPKRTISAAARKRMAKAQRERWAKIRGEREVPAKKVTAKKTVVQAKKKETKRVVSPTKTAGLKRKVVKKAAKRSTPALARKVVAEATSEAAE